jgi:hypothetical protein
MKTTTAGQCQAHPPPSQVIKFSKYVVAQFCHLHFKINFKGRPVLIGRGRAGGLKWSLSHHVSQTSNPIKFPDPLVFVPDLDLVLYKLPPPRSDFPFTEIAE